MTDTNLTTDVLDGLDREILFIDDLDEEITLEDTNVHKRVAVRYRRRDIKAVVKIRSFFFPRLLPVILHDISSKGAGIITQKKISLKASVSLYLLFKDGTRFDIDAVVASSKHSNFYGLKFDNYNRELAEHILNTQTDLKFN